MKPFSSQDWLDTVQRWQRRRYPTYLLLLLSLNLLLAPAVYGATGSTLDKTQAYALGLLGLGTIGLGIYLFTVMFQPERF